jgi:hypothetical protein
MLDLNACRQARGEKKKQKTRVGKYFLKQFFVKTNLANNNFGV